LEWRGGGGGLLADLVRAPGRRRREHERRGRVAQVLEVCGLAGVARRPAGTLPVATARLVELARAIVDPPRVLLLDEPTAGLDEGAAALLGERVRRVRDEEGCAVLLVEHDVAFVTAHCDQVTALDVGRVIAEGTPSAVRADPAVQAAYLG
jgi:branched-chain amino acid transport system ATP-binding protein